MKAAYILAFHTHELPRGRLFMLSSPPLQIFSGKGIFYAWSYPCNLADGGRGGPQTLGWRHTSQLCCQNKVCWSQRTSHVLHGGFLCMVNRKYYDSMTMQFHQGTSQSMGCESHTTDGDFGGAACTLRVLLTGYIAVATLSPVWRRINEWHASTFCRNICDREISGIFPEKNLCSGPNFH